MGDLIQPVKDGKIVNNTASDSTSKDKKTGTGELGKDAFLQLLVTQMKYQDPLNPNTDTQFVAQLATFSQLEQMQNLSQTAINSQALSLVGRDVIMKAEDSSGNVVYTSGVVDFITMQAGKAQLSVNGELYGIDQLSEVIDSTYLIEQGLPGINEATTLTYDKADPQDLTFKVNLGSGYTVASAVAVQVNGKVLDTEDVTLKDDTVTISKDALSELEVGTYKAVVGFNDAFKTTVTDKLVIQVKDSGTETE